ncbi:uncharacterized protein LOC141907738 [Tubulanus polymorphus]|uniref:uncharacterized protein LOC141907738 n=1 Tax=Tubulanus polymorphus TaxID=672921 RepID=UPI003DA3EF46
MPRKRTIKELHTDYPEVTIVKSGKMKPIKVVREKQKEPMLYLVKDGVFQSVSGQSEIKGNVPDSGSSNLTEPESSDYESLDPTDSHSESATKGSYGDYGKRRVSEVHAWDELSDKLTESALKQYKPMSFECFICEKIEQEPFRCDDCHPFATYCLECSINLHTYLPLHRLKQWQAMDGFFNHVCPREPPLLSRLPCNCTLIEEKIITVFDSYGRCDAKKVQHCECQSLPIALTNHRLWPASPSQPTYAASFDFLKLFTTLQIEGQLSARAFADTYAVMNAYSLDQVSQLYRLLTSESLSRFRLITCEEYLLSKSYTYKRCLACPEDNGKLFVSADANFGLVRKKNAGRSYSTPQILRPIFLDQGNVDSYVLRCCDTSKLDDGECNNFQAGTDIRAKNKAVNLDYTGVMGLACSRHEIPLAMLNLRHGERLSYVVSLLNHMVAELQVEHNQLELVVMYDIACVLQKYLKKPDISRMLPGNLQFAIPLFHCYGHQANCQTNLSPRRLENFGLTDGETMERFWSYIRRFALITKEQTPNRRLELLTLAAQHYTWKKMNKIEFALFERFKRADVAIEQAEKELADISLIIPEIATGRDDIFEQWNFQEKVSVTHKRDKGNPSSWQEKYVKLLSTYYSVCTMIKSSNDGATCMTLVKERDELDARLQSIENIRNLTRWSSSQYEYINLMEAMNDRKRCAYLRQMRTLACEMKVLDKASKKHAGGQKIASRLIKQRKRVVKSIKKAINLYNCLTADINRISSKDALNLESTIYQPLSNEMSALTTMQRKALGSWFTLKRSIEEKQMVQVELSHVIQNLEIQRADLLAAREDDDADQGLKSLIYEKLKFLHKRISSCQEIYSNLVEKQTAEPEDSNSALYTFDSDDQESDTEVVV